MPFFSIITINLNNASGLKKTIESVISQTFKDFEYIVIDGASIDGSINVIKSFERGISFWISEKDTGIYHAMNKGIVLAHGTYCLFLNSGDVLVNKDVLQSVMQMQPSEDLIYGNMQTADAAGKIKHLKMPGTMGIKHLYADTLWHPVTFIKRNLFLKYGKYDEQFKIAGDYEFFVRMIISEKVSLEHLEIEISCFDISGVSANRNNREHLKLERLIVQKKYFNPLLLFLFRIYSLLRS